MATEQNQNNVSSYNMNNFHNESNFNNDFNISNDIYSKIHSIDMINYKSLNTPINHLSMIIIVLYLILLQITRTKKYYHN